MSIKRILMFGVLLSIGWMMLRQYQANAGADFMDDLAVVEAQILADADAPSGDSADSASDSEAGGSANGEHANGEQAEADDDHGGGGHGDPAARTFEFFFFVLLAAVLGRWGARKLKQPAVLGELLIGVVLGRYSVCVKRRFCTPLPQQRAGECSCRVHDTQQRHLVAGDSYGLLAREHPIHGHRDPQPDHEYHAE